MNDPQFNPYSAPNAEVADPQSGVALAGRGIRLVAAIIDALILMAIIGPMMFFSGYFQAAMSGQQPSVLTQIMWMVIGFIVFVAVQGYFLNQSGQTIAKKMFGIKIVDLNGNKPEFLKLLLLRYGVFHLAQLVPVLGPIVAGLVNPLMIFGQEQRCLHDVVAGTRVVQA